MNICFGTDPQPFEQGSSYKIPDEIYSCLKGVVGEQRFKEINSGKSVPTFDEKKKANECFAKLNSEQKNFLPPPPEEIHFLEEDNEAVQFAGATQEKKKVKKKEVGGKVTLSGKGPPDMTITVYIYSDPIVVTTKTDENGDWVYEMEKPLDEGSHVAYALIKSESGSYVRSSVINFDVLAAESEPIPQALLDEDEATQIQKKFIYYSIAGVLVVALISTAIYYYLHMRRQTKHINGELKENVVEGSVSGEGNGESEPGAGPVN